MPRRVKTSLQPIQIAGIAAAILAMAGAGWMALGHRHESALGGTDLSLRDYLQNSNALSNNSYRIEGVIRGRLDEDWKSSDGRLFSVEVEEGGDTALLPVLVPPRFNSTNIQRDQRFRFRVTVQAETGVLEVTDLGKS